MERYRIIRELGAGGMGTVFEAFDHHLNRPVALKKLNRRENPNDVARFEREAKILAGLRHPNIVEILDWGQDSDGPFFTMPLLPGEDLLRGVKAGKALPFPAVLRILIQVAEALAYLHGKGIVHRDLKPSNILVEGSGRARIVDFGLSRVPSMTRITSQGSLLGTVRYMAPEMFREDQEFGPAQDMYSLALTSHELLAGAPCIESPSPVEIIQARLERDPPGLPARRDIPAWFIDLQRRTLSREPGTRPDASEYLAILQRFPMERRDPVAPPPPITTEAAPPGPRKKGPLVWLLMGMMILCLYRWMSGPGGEHVTPPIPQGNPQLSTPRDPVFPRWRRIEALIPASDRGNATSALLAELVSATGIDLGPVPAWRKWVELGRWWSGERSSQPVPWPREFPDIETRFLQGEAPLLVRLEHESIVADAGKRMQAALRALEAEPGNGLVWLLFARALSADGCPEECRRAQDEGLMRLPTVWPRKMGAVTWESLVLAWIARDLDVEKEWMALTSGREDAVEAWTGLNTVLEGTRPLLLEDLFLKGTRDPATGPAVTLVRGNVGSGNEASKAVAIWEAGLERFPGSPLLLERLLRHHLEMGDLTKARLVLQQVGAHSPGLDEQIARLGFLDSYHRSERVTTPGVDDSTRLTLQLMEVFRCMEKGDTNQAEGILRQLHGIVPGNPGVRRLLIELAGLRGASAWNRRIVEAILFEEGFSWPLWEVAAGAFASHHGRDLMKGYLERARRSWPQEPLVELVHALWDSRSGYPDEARNRLGRLPAEAAHPACETCVEEILLRPICQRIFDIPLLGEDLVPGSHAAGSGALLFDFPAPWMEQRRGDLHWKLVKQVRALDFREVSRSQHVFTPVAGDHPFWLLRRIWASFLSRDMAEFQAQVDRSRWASRNSHSSLWVLREIEKLLQVWPASLEWPPRPRRMEVILVTPGPGGGPHVRVLEAATGRLLNEFSTSGVPDVSGLSAALGDVDHDGWSDIATLPGPGSDPEVSIFDGTPLVPGQLPLLLRKFRLPSLEGEARRSLSFAKLRGDESLTLVIQGGGTGRFLVVHDPATGDLLKDLSHLLPPSGDVAMAPGDLDGDGMDELVIATGGGASCEILILDGLGGRCRERFSPGEVWDPSDLQLATGDLDADGAADILLSAIRDGRPVLTAWRGRDRGYLWSRPMGHLISNQAPGIALVDVDGDGMSEIVTAGPPGDLPWLHLLGGPSNRVLPWAPGLLLAFEAGHRGGVRVTTGNWLSGKVRTGSTHHE